MRRLDERVTVTLAAQRFQVSEALIRKWISRYKLTDPSGEYRFGDLVDIEWRTRHSPGARRKLTLAGQGVTIWD